jgi:hypothetical protein
MDGPSLFPATAGRLHSSPPLAEVPRHDGKAAGAGDEEGQPALVDLDYPLDIGSALDDAAAVSKRRHNVRIFVRALWNSPHDAAAWRSASRIQDALER